LNEKEKKEIAMKRIKVIAQAAYKFNDFCERWVTDKEISLLAEKGIDLQIVSVEGGPERIKNEKTVDVFIVDWYQGRASEDSVKLCRQLHPNAKIVMIDSHWYTMDEAEKVEASRKYDYFCHTCPLAEPKTVEKLVEILFYCDLMERHIAETLTNLRLPPAIKG
jgi:hypothetical protein